MLVGGVVLALSGLVVARGTPIVLPRAPWRCGALAGAALSLGGLLWEQRRRDISNGITACISATLTRDRGRRLLPLQAVTAHSGASSAPAMLVIVCAVGALLLLHRR